MCSCEPGWTCARCTADEDRRAEEVRPDDVTPERGAESPQEATATNG